MAMKKKGYRGGGKVGMKKKGYRGGGKVMGMKSKGMKNGGKVTGKKMTVAQLRAAAKKMGYKVTKA
jgi:hypothetical protein|tara:strand:+ start:895 stop:1092 length:198 start_codon:yes stop_codon:yes gene_type:complete